MSKSIGNVVDPEKLIVGGKDQRVCSQKNLFPCSFAMNVHWSFAGRTYLWRRCSPSMGF